MLLKPSRLASDVSKWERRRAKETTTQRERRQAANLWRAISAVVKSRDGGCCRVCGRTTVTTGDPRLIGAAHHLVYRSAGGTDELSNLVWLCGQCHQDEHDHWITLSGTAADLTVAPGPLQMRA